MRTRNDLWAMAEHIRNMVIDLRSWIYWLGYDRSQIPEENIDRAYDDIKAEIRRFLEQDGLRAIVRKTAEELIYELDDHMHIFKGMGTMDRDSEVALRKSTNRLIDLENSMRSEFHNGKFEGDEIG